MTSITTQQTKLNLELVPKENRLDIGKCNGRIPRGLKPKEETFQVVLDALALTPCYPAFLITADVPEVYMHQFWNCIYKHDDFYRFKIDKKKRFKLTLEVFRDIFQICPRVPGRDFDALPSEEDTISFLRDLGHTGVINSLNDVVIDQMHQPWRTFAAIINRSLSGKTSGLDKLRLSRAQILWGMYHQKNVDYVELLWEDFTYQIDNKVYKKQEKMYYPRFTKVIIHHFLIQEKSLSWRNRIGMHTSKDDYLINTLRFVSRREASQIYGAVLPECLTSPEMKESKAYKTYLGYATGEVPPKVARKFKKASPSKKESELVPGDKEPIKKGKRLKTPTKKSASKPATGIVIREPPAKRKSKRKEKEKVDVAHGKGIELLSEVALSKKSQMKEERMKSLRDFHKTHPSGFGMVAEKPPSVEKITPTVTSEGTGDKPGVLDVTNDDSSESESESWGNDEDDSNNEQELSDESSKQENESEEQELDSEQDEESDDDDQEEEEFDQENESEDDEMKNARLEEPTETATRIVQVFRFNDRITALEKEVADLKKDPLHTQVTSLVDSHLDTRLGETRQEFMNSLSESLTARIKEQRGQKDKDKDEDPSAESDRGLKKRKTSKDAEPTTGPKKKESTSDSSKGTKSQPKSTRKSVQSEEPVFEVADSAMPQDQAGNLGENKDEPRMRLLLDEGPSQNWLMTLAASTSTDKLLKDFDELMSTPIDFSIYILNGLKIENLTQEVLLGPAFKLLKGTRSNYVELEYDFEECYKALSEKLVWENPEGNDYPFDLSKPIPLITRGKRQRVPFFINNDLKYLQGGISTMTYTTSTTKTKATKYDLPGIKDMVLNIWSPVKVAYDRYALWVTHVKVMRKHGYEYLEEIVVRRADNILYRFKEGDFPRLRINDIEDMLILVKRVEDLQLGVESYQKKINVTKPDTTRPDLRKRHPYTPYKDPQGFIYVDDYKRNRLMRSDELYKFSDGTLTRLLSSLEDITKNIDMEYLPKRRWSTLEKKRAHFMIKDINKLLKERRMMRSLEKFIGGRLYGTDLRLLQRTI
ncbi:hypothetical protein Tco_0831359 [Tanacetum coccineum]